MGFEFKDRREEKKSAEDVAPAKPTVLEIVQDRMERASEALANGDLAAANAVAAECQNPPVTYGDVVPFKKTVRGEKQTWRSVGYVAAILPLGQAQVFMARAVGMRSDGQVFTADYAIPPVWVEGEDFTSEARKRMDTFLACSCDGRGPCKFHGETMPGPLGPGKWLKSDLKRLGKMQGAQLPEAVEALMKAEAERANSRIVVPGMV